MATEIEERHQMRIVVGSLQIAQEIWPEAKVYGDIKLAWDPDNAGSLGAAQTAFDKAIARGFRAFRIDKAGKQTGSPITAFDPDAERLLLVGQFVGG